MVLKCLPILTLTMVLSYVSQCIQIEITVVVNDSRRKGLRCVSGSAAETSLSSHINSTPSIGELARNSDPRRPLTVPKSLCRSMHHYSSWWLRRFCRVEVTSFVIYFPRLRPSLQASTFGPNRRFLPLSTLTASRRGSHDISIYSDFLIIPLALSWPW